MGVVWWKVSAAGEEVSEAGEGVSEAGEGVSEAGEGDIKGRPEGAGMASPPSCSSLPHHTTPHLRYATLPFSPAPTSTGPLLHTFFSTIKTLKLVTPNLLIDNNLLKVLEFLFVTSDLLFLREDESL